ncbi:uncharacterized protein BXZ73DRAFT_99838 [Epithele typhae]|uniref:uncharacterized protein n=1 Tax=Epithele typhae TaxID=378194 RepID=UPI0020072872|nr:uncharacterized protein BXZ73DRAFT_99838 [Epithele typhae]KAH9938776.1 hypothetical protein BXZ73DRAFT_99838 [Epithele typhae]
MDSNTSNAAMKSTPSLGITFGAFLVGTFVASIQYGFLCHQVANYFNRFPQDSRWLKYHVIVVLSLSTVVVALCMHVSYHYLVSNFFDPQRLEVSVWSFNLLGLFAASQAYLLALTTFSLISSVQGALASTSEMFFIRRVYLIGRKFRPLVALASFFVAGEWILGITASIRGFLNSDAKSGYGDALLSSIGALCMISADVLITSTLIVTLRQSRTGINQTDSILDRLVLYAVNTGLLMTLFNIVSCAFGFVLPGNLIYVGISISDILLYGNSVMTACVLNAMTAPP